MISREEMRGVAASICLSTQGRMARSEHQQYRSWFIRHPGLVFMRTKEEIHGLKTRKMSMVNEEMSKWLQESRGNNDNSNEKEHSVGAGGEGTRRAEDPLALAVKKGN